MTNELEKQFYNIFGIKQRNYTQCTSMGCKYVYKNCNNCQFYNVYKVDYPQITDHILLELICIINQIDLYFYGENDYFMAVNYKDLKEEVIAKCKRLADKNAFSEITGENIKHQVRTLFEEGNQ